MMADREELMDRLEEAAIKLASPTLRLLPLWVEAAAFGAVVSAIIERTPEIKERLGELEAKSFRFDASDVDKSFYLLIKEGTILVRPHMAGSPDAVMRGEVRVLLRVLLGKEDPDTVFFSRKLEINGDTAAALHLKNILSAI